MEGASPSPSTNHANKDEGLKCLEIARRALEAGDAAKAARFAEKAVRLYPSEAAQALLASVQRASTTAGASSSSSGAANGGPPSGMGAGPGLRQRQAHAAAAARPSAVRREPEDEDHKATPEQRSMVAAIRRETCYYTILGVQRSATDDDLKRAYKQLALKLHPDKNKARGADEAFKAVSRAFSCLSDPSKRRVYDATGQEDGQPSGRGAAPFGGMRRSAGGGFNLFDDEVDADELFRMFFGGNPFMSTAAQMYGFGGGGAGAFAAQQRAAQQRAGHQRAGGNGGAEAGGLRALMSIAPLILLVLFNLLSQPSRPAYSLSPVKQFNTLQATAAHQVPFWVEGTREFERRYPPGSRERSRVEMQIELEWKDAMQRQCYNQRVLRNRHEYWGQKERAAAVDLSACTELAHRFGPRTRVAGTAAAAATAGEASATAPKSGQAAAAAA